MDELARSRRYLAAAAERQITAMRVPGRPMPRLLAAGVTGTLVAATLCMAPAPAAARLGADPAATAVQPGAMSLTSRGGAPAGRRTVALVRPTVARHAHAASRGFAPAAATYNPATGNQGFPVFVQGNAALGATSTTGAVAMGGNLTVGSNFTAASQTAGTYTAPGDSVPTGLLVGGSINWAGSNSGGTVSVGSSAYVKVGNMTGSIIPSNGKQPDARLPDREQLRVKTTGRPGDLSAAILREPVGSHQLHQRVQHIHQPVRRHGELCQFAGAHERERDGAESSAFLQHERLCHAYPRHAEPSITHLPRPCR